MAGEIISERRARSNRIGGRHHLGFAGDFPRNPHRPANPTVNLRLQGIAAALGNLAGAQMQPDLAAIILDSLGVTVADLERAGADAYDLAPLQSLR
jgi:hypothetical protein